MKIYIIGQSGTGKTTFASLLSEKLHITHIELDTIWFKYNKHRPTFRDEAYKILDQENWVVEGKHRTVRKRVMELADSIIYLDFPLNIGISNILKRAKETNEPMFKSLKHVLKVIKEFPDQKKQIKSELKEHSKKLVILESMSEIDQFLKNNRHNT